MNLSLAGESGVAWRKSSYSGGSGSGNCVEVAAIAGSVAIRDSKDPCGPMHLMRPNAFRSLVGRIKTRDLDL
ncbi:DUF397 domain-containing protein [Actinomadura sp. HBU206391]|uniref:DUF397 domain-containing protein n=1 Tax=Actinomadura sp. HBU206391 TaxID=2731692 RepID=UPI00164FC32A|nr:DUF397 domain-containing protein [Actinomadura sp. HBU206391]MBC6456604.1 DUF397 domain-containing protein [Actinomadura sp. HBU206391]